MESDIIKNAESDLAQAQARIAELESELTEERSRRTKIEAFLEMSAYYSRPGAGSRRSLPLGLRNMTIADGCAALMAASGGSAKATDMIKSLRESGKLKGQGRGDYGTVIQTLQRFPDRFEKVSPGLWRLKVEKVTAAEPAPHESMKASDLFRTPSSLGSSGLGSVEGHPVATG